MPVVYCLSRVSRRVRPPGSGTSFQAQVLFGFVHSSHSSVSKPATLNAVVSLTLAAIGTQSPTRTCWHSGRIRSALGRAALSNRS